MQVSVVSLFPEMIATLAEYGVVGRAAERGLLSLSTVNPRDYTADVHRTVDDRPYGGGPGMVLAYAPMAAAIGAAKRTLPENSPVVCLSPRGSVFDQTVARRYAALDGIVLVAGRYEGIDERLIESLVDEEVSLGDFVMSGGEIAAMAIVDATTRLLPGVLGDDESAQQDSFMNGLLDCPHYTRPESVAGLTVPAVLLSGDHAAIARWREKMAIGQTYERRPELLDERNMTERQRELLAEFLKEQRP